MNEQVKSAITSIFGTDTALETKEGIVIDYGKIWFRIKRAGGANKAYGRLLAKRQEPFRSQIERGCADEDALERMFAEVYADTIIIEYGLPGPVAAPYSQPVPFVKTEVVELLLSNADLFLDLQQQARKAALFRQAELEDAKNSEPVSAGNSNTETNCAGQQNINASPAPEPSSAASPPSSPAG